MFGAETPVTAPAARVGGASVGPQPPADKAKAVTPSVAPTQSPCRPSTGDGKDELFSSPFGARAPDAASSECIGPSPTHPLRLRLRRTTNDAPQSKPDTHLGHSGRSQRKRRSHWRVACRYCYWALFPSPQGGLAGAGVLQLPTDSALCALRFVFCF